VMPFLFRFLHRFLQVLCETAGTVHVVFSRGTCVEMTARGRGRPGGSWPLADETIL
jgi:hypothetical protein